MSDQTAPSTIRIGWLIDGQGGPVRNDVAMAVRDGRVVSITPSAQQAIATVASLDLSHATVLPALMDAHVHLTWSGTSDSGRRAAQLNHAPRQAAAAIRRHMLAHWQCGVVAVRDGGDRRGDARHYKSNGGTCEPDPPLSVKVPGWAWHSPGRYGAMLGRAPLHGMSLAEAVAAELDRMDHVKVLQSGINSLDRFGHQGGPQFSEEALRAVVRLARGAQKPVMAHANGPTAVRMAIESGCDSIEHGYFMGEDNLKRLVDKGAVWVPTAIPMAALAASDDLSASQQEVARRTLDHQLEQVQKAHSLGVTIALGTDAGGQGVDHGTAVRRELSLLMAAGLGLSQAVRCATLNAARLMRLAGRGALIPGWSADFIVVPGSPDALPETLQTVQAICLAGRWFDPINSFSRT
jgi:imidazolonepropionase-like amidohydrolase